MEAGVGRVLLWGSLSFALVIAGVVAVPVSRWRRPRRRRRAARAGPLRTRHICPNVRPAGTVRSGGEPAEFALVAPG